MHAEPFDPANAATDLLAGIGRPPPTAVEALPGGRNNKVWRVCTPDGRVLLKRYHWSPSDPRDRLGHEWSFLAFLREAGIFEAPEPLAKDERRRIALIEFLDGRAPAEVTAHHVRAATDFFLGMNRHRHRASHLPPVSEGCFSVQEHLAIAKARVRRLEALAANTPAARLCQTHILPVWQEIERRGLAIAEAERRRPLPPEERCLSPSDFGFHNSIEQPDGRLRFVDFEYAGWDDPAKTIADFCNQPDGLLAPGLAGIFRAAALAASPAPEAIVARLRLLEPLYQLKWACICLNPFLPDGSFDPARPDRSPAAQLARALVMVTRAEENLDAPNPTPY